MQKGDLKMGQNYGGFWLAKAHISRHVHSLAGLRGPRGLRGLYLTKNFYECETPDNGFRKCTDRELTP